MSNCRCMLVEIPVKPDPKSLAVLLDAARACYGDDSEQVRWLLNPEAVRTLIKTTPASPFGDRQETRCWWCQVEFLDETHSRTCQGAAAWRALGDPRGAADIERAHEEAKLQNVRLFPQWLPRTATHGEWPPLWRAEEVTLGPGPEDDMQRAMAAIRREGQPWAPIAQVVGEAQRQINERIESACERILGHRLTVHDRGALTLRHDRSQGGLVHVTILRNDVEQVRISAAVLGDAVDLTEHWAT